jgi:hypothetical protein
VLEGRPTQFSIVVSANAHNPTIVNPDFLRLQDIVPTDWTPDGPLVSSPPFSAVQYSSGISIVVDPNRLQINDTSDELDPLRSPASSVADRYVQVLPHIPYNGVGINFQVAAESADPASFLKERFLKTGSWDTSEQPLTAVGLRFVYALAGGRLTISLDVGEVGSEHGEDASSTQAVISADASSTQTVISADANFHRDVSDADGVRSALGNIRSDWELFQRFLRSALNGDGN